MYEHIMYTPHVCIAYVYGHGWMKYIHDCHDHSFVFKWHVALVDRSHLCRGVHKDVIHPFWNMAKFDLNYLTTHIDKLMIS
jgi:hypothetical protein